MKVKQAQYATDKAIDLLENALLYTKDKSLDDLPCSNLDASGFLLPAARDCIAEAVKQLRAVRESLKRSEGK